MSDFAPWILTVTILYALLALATLQAPGMSSEKATIVLGDLFKIILLLFAIDRLDHMLGIMKAITVLIENNLAK
jgi:hypothetical protein